MPASMVLAVACIIAVPFLAVALIALLVVYKRRWSAYRRSQMHASAQSISGKLSGRRA